ncbi:glutathione S-transferase 1-1 [Cryptotermes secundus]|uniref:glutathione S-transferase 1-1 n=1 Tax=Cryptotermes secundus TaxID=105785 RepID=UPI000CD7C1EB|nr:glutathione S-transferase 1-1 [Cryptotermes secundus]
MPIDLYHIVGSPPCHSVRLLLKTLGVGVNLKSVDLLNGENKSPEFTKMNPQHTVPTLNDNGFYVAESRTILGYLVDQYGKDDSLYPKDIKERTRINQILYFDLGTLYQRFSDYYFPIIETGKCGEPGKLVKLEEAFQILDKYLEGQNWVTGKHLTIADFTVVSTVASIECVGFDVSKYANVSRWYSNAQKKLPGYDEIVGSGCKALKEYFDQYKK